MKEILENIQLINKYFSDSEWVKAQSGEVLSYTAIKLAASKAYLIEVKTDAHRSMLRAEIAMETSKGEAYLRMKDKHGATAAVDAKNTDSEYIEKKEKYVDAKVTYDMLRSVVADSHDLIESIRSRIIDLHGSRKDEGVK